jgi:hypothetical protein
MAGKIRTMISDRPIPDPVSDPYMVRFRNFKFFEGK